MTREIAARGGCLFCAIAAGQAPAHVVHESERLVAVLDIAPIRPGHLQIVPRAHYPFFDVLPQDLASEVLHLGQRFADVQRRIYGVSRVGFLFTGGDIPHAHAHVVPLVSAGDITSRRYIAEEKITFQAPPPVTEADLVATAEALRRGLASGGG